ncbi:MAG: O-acetylhomoserine aminocarboxypropyltransferase/cysteine synthase [Bifidobacteriaceae bacterium]|jgi:O-acetylhomoserine (thiol)-lyase|nr:O-acetylhomoserine aminocarboxypropyltransferase/cysteine synthase [Bifidobacteriaceae bacterium]
MTGLRPVREWGFSTRQIHAGAVPDPASGALATPIAQTTAYQFPSAREAADRFAGQSLGFTYSRINNPTQEALEARLADLDGARAATALGSGQAAVAYALMTLAEAGDHVVASPALYGGTLRLLRESLPRRGVKVSFVGQINDPDEWEKLTRSNTKAYFAEAIANPSGQILDIEAVAAAAHRQGLPLVVDSTLATPYVTRPIEWGADVVVHSVSKFLAGHGTVIAGAVLDAGRFDFTAAAARFPAFNQEAPGYPGLVLARDFGAGGRLSGELGNIAFNVKLRLDQLHDFGAAIAPLNAFLALQGVETLSLRMERHLANAKAVAAFLDDHSAALAVRHSSLPSSPFKELAAKYAPAGPGAVMTFDLAGGRAAAERFIAHLKLFHHVANIGDVRSLAIHPASTTHGQMSPAEQAAAGVGPGMIRLSVGLEDAADILADLDQALAAASGAPAGE